jgi:hypothetical protein
MALPKESLEMLAKFNPGIDLVVKPADLERRDLPRPRISPERTTLVADVGEHEYGVRLQFFPPDRVMRVSRLPRTMKQPRWAVFHPPVDLTEFTRAEQAPLSAIHPYTYLHNGAKFGIEVAVPYAEVDAWSDEKRRPARFDELPASLAMGLDEIYQVQQSVGAVVRVNGKPLAFRHTGRFMQPKRETFFGFSEDVIPTPGKTTDRAFVNERSEAFPPSKETGVSRIKKEPLKFQVTGRRGSASNANFDTQNGLVQVVFVRYDIGPERVIGYDDNVSSKQRARWGDSGLSVDPYRFISKPTLQGEIRFGEPKYTKAKIHDVSNIEPIAVVNLALVGREGRK